MARRLRTQSTKRPGRGGVVVPLRMPADLKSKVETTAEQVHLPEQQVMRLSLDRGLDVLIAQLTGNPANA